MAAAAAAIRSAIPAARRNTFFTGTPGNLLCEGDR